MEEAVQVWRFKIFSRKPVEPTVEPEPPVEEDPLVCRDAPTCKSCRYVKSKTCGSSEKDKKCKKPPPNPEPSLLSLKNSVSANCYSCCCNLKEFFKEAFKAIGGDPNNRVCDVLCEITDLLLALANDCVLFLRRVYCCLLEAIANKS